MKQLREYIRKEIKTLAEAIIKMPLPDDAKRTLFGNLKLRKNQINGIKAIKSIIPSYRIFLKNNQSFTISDIGNNFGFKKIKINGKEYDLLNKDQLPLALKALDGLQTNLIVKTTGDEETGDTDIDTGGTTGGTTGDEEEPAEEPAEEPEA